MAKETFKTRDGQTVVNGDEVTLELAYDTASVLVSGKVRSFDQVERVYDDEGIAISKTSEQRWEILTDDPQYPAIGFRPENVLTKTA